VKKIAYAGALGVIGIISTEFGIIGVLPDLAKFYGLTIETAGLLLSAFALTIALFGPFVALFTSGINRKKLMVIAVLLFALSNFASAFAPPFWLLMIIRIIPAFLHPVFFSSAVAAAIKDAPPLHQHKRMGIVIGGIAVSQVTIIPFSTYISSEYGWLTAYMIQGVVSFAAMVYMLIVLPDMPVDEKKTLGSQLIILKRPRFIVSSAMNFFMIAAWFATYSYFADYLQKVKHMNPQQISYMLLLFGIAGVFSNWIAGELLSKSVPVVTAFFLTGTLFLPFVFIYSEDSFYVQALVVAVWGIMYGPCFLTSAAYMISAAPDAMEFANTLQISFGNLGVSLGTAVSGFFIGKYSIAIAPWVGALFGIGAVVMMIIRAAMEHKGRQENKLLRHHESSS